MTGPPTAMRPIETAPTVNRAQPAVLVRMHNGELVGRVSTRVADSLLSSGAAKPVGKDGWRYLRLEPDIVIPKSSRGWELFEEQRRKHGDYAVRRGAIAFDRRPLKWQSPKPNFR